LVAQVHRALTLDGCDAAQIRLGGAEQPHAPPEQYRRDMQHDLVDQPGGQRLLGDAALHRPGTCRVGTRRNRVDRLAGLPSSWSAWQH
jgi:hypothetical protein